MTPSPLISEEAKAKIAKNKYESFTLKYLPADVKQPPENLICTNCTNAMWFTSDKEIKAFCKVMHAIVHSSKDNGKSILCDGNVPEEQSEKKEEAPQEESPSLELTPEAELDLESFITDEVNNLKNL